MLLFIFKQIQKRERKKNVYVRLLNSTGKIRVVITLVRRKETQ